MADIPSGSAVGPDHLKAAASRRPKKVEGRVRVKDWVPGTAIVHNGEPTATELALLRFKMSETERASVCGIIQQIASRHKELLGQGELAVDNYIKAIADAIKEQGRATPIVEVWDDVLVKPLLSGNGYPSKGERA